jgi:hypothetical protein
MLSFRSVLHSKEEDKSLEWLRLKENPTSGMITLFSVLHMLNLAFLLSSTFPDINICFVASKNITVLHSDKIIKHVIINTFDNAFVLNILTVVCIITTWLFCKVYFLKKKIFI